MSHRILEICTYNIRSCFAAQQAGASRIELCASPAEGGVTPGYGTIRYTLENITIPAYIMIRPRGGDFVYDAAELSIMHKDIVVCKSLGCPGIATGVLLQDGNVDTDELKRIVDLAYPMQVTFHKAFDRTPDPYHSLEEITSAGCHRILTSGLEATATKGMQLLSELVSIAGDRITIMPGGGVRSTNIKALANATGARELHSSALLPTDTGNMADIEEIRDMVRLIK